MKILLVHADNFPWATQRRAERFKREWKDDEVEIAYYKDLDMEDGERFDVIHILFSGGIGKIKEFILKYRNKVFTTLASQRTLDGFFDNLDNLMEIYRKTNCCVCLSPELTEKLRDLAGHDRAIYIPNGVDGELFQPDRFVAGFVGYTKEHKGYALAKQACEELGIELRVAENIPHEKMPIFYRQINCLIIPTESEGCNNPTLEALAMNVPVITTNTGIARYLEGVILAERNVESLKEQLRKLNTRINILKEYNWTYIASQYRKLYVEK